ncbi:MAG: ComEA family DNA-binding protein [Bacteroidota bacterium]
MKRRIFFWLEKLKVAPGERKAVTGLLVLLVFLGGLNLALSPSVAFDGDRYHELDRQFAERTEQLEAEEEKLMEQYYPSSKSEIVETKIDTTTEDSTSEKQRDEDKDESEKVAQDDLEGKINVNKASEKTLQTLPGIGPAYAERIVNYRKEKGEFESVEDLKNIKGIAQKRLDKLAPFIKLKDSN